MSYFNPLLPGADYSGYGRTVMPTQQFTAGTPTLTNEQMVSLSQRMFNTVNQANEGVSAWEHIARFSTGVVIDTADTIAASPLNPFGQERGDIWAMTSPEQQSYYKRNQAAIEGTAAVVGGLTTAVAAEALIVPRLAAGLASSSALTATAPWRAAARWNEATRVGMLTAQRAAAESGEAFSLFSSAAGRQYMANRVVAGAAKTMRTVPLEYGVMWNNEAFNSGDWATEGFWIGAGTVLGGTVGAIGGRAVARQTANSKEIRDLRSIPLAMSGVSNDLLSADHLDAAMRVHIPDVMLKESAYTTEYLLASRSANPNKYDEATANATRLNSLRGTYFEAAVDSIQKQINIGIEGVSTLKGQVGKIPEAEAIVAEVAKKDPFVFHGMAEAGIMNESYAASKKMRDAHIESLYTKSQAENKLGNLQEAQKLAHKARVLKQRESYLLVDGAWVTPESELGVAASGFKPDAVTITKIGDTEGIHIGLPGGGKITIDASLRPMRGSTPINVGAMNLKDRMALTHGMERLVKNVVSPSLKTQFKLTKTGMENWFTLDTAAEILERGGKIEFDSAVTRMSTVEDLMRKSLKLKAQAVLEEIGTIGKITPEIRFKYNLPMATAMETIEDSAGDGFREWLKTAATDRFTTKELGLALDDMKAIQGIDLLPAAGTPGSRVDGNMFGFNKNRKGEWLRPMLGYFDPKSQIEQLSKQGHGMAVTRAKAERTAILMRDNTHVSSLVTTLAQMPELRQAMNVAGLSVDQLTAMGGGVAQALGEVLPKRFIARDNQTILAASKLQEATERHGRAVFEQLVNSVGMQDVLTQITSTGGAAQRAMLDQYFTLRPGWDVEKMTLIDKDRYGFELKDTKSNRQRLGMTESERWTPVMMPNERLNTPIVVDSVGKSAIESYNKLTDELIRADNTIRRATGLRDVEYKPFFAPVADTKNAHVGFVFGPDDKLIPGRTIVAKSQEEYDKLVARTIDEFGAGSGFTVRTKGHLKKMRDIYDEAAMDWIDPGVSSASAGLGAQKGGLTGAYVRQGAFNEALEWIQRKTMAQSQDALKQMMNESILVARANSVAENALQSTPKRNAFDVYEHMLTGRGESYAETSIIDKKFKSIEEGLNKVIANSALAIPARHIMDLAERLGMSPGDLNGKKTFESIAKEMGPYTPFANVMEYLDSRGVRPPPTIKGMASKMNTIAASVYLRWFELPHAILNGLGLMAAMPSTIMGGRAPISTFVDVRGTQIGFTDGLKITANSMKRMFQSRSGADWEHMLKNGDATQSVIEYHQQLGSIQSQAGFMKWIDKADKWASIASEKSEAWSRQVSHFVGLELADIHGIKGMEARHNFAREVANSMIADYAPINRPELFASGFGSLIGLFQSYALNHYTKMFRWMEKGEYGKAGLQAAVQATMFGVPGTYGIGALMDLRDSATATGSEPTALDMIYNRFGPVLGGAIAHGSISEITGLALWTRGDMSPRVPGAGGSLPAIDLGMKVANGFMDGVSSFMNAMPGEGVNALAEVVSREMPNRVLKSWLMLANGGNEIDAYGQVMTETHTWLDTAARTIGVRSSRQQAELEAFYAGKAAMERDKGKMERLRESFRAAVRNNSGKPEDVNPVQYFNDYVEAGGNPRAFKTWVKNLLRDSDSARSVQSLKGSLQTTKSALEVWRYGAYGAWAVE